MKITAVVVTHNRLNDLKVCINALKKQTRKVDEIIVVNNDSKDGTKEWLDKQTNITTIHQLNLGGAGGFHNGMKLAYENGCDWVWCMDDDGFADTNCLKNLLNRINNNYEVVGPFVLDKNKNNKLAFPCPCIKMKEKELAYNGTYVKKLFPEIIENWAVLFNGVLISQDVISEIGFPLKELFIWGDEFEYLRRIKRKGFRYYTVTNAIFYHPKMKLKTHTNLFGIEVIIDYKKELKYFYFFRNLGYLSKEDYKFYNIKYLISQFVFYLTPKNFKPDLACFFLNSYFKGILLKL